MSRVLFKSSFLSVFLFFLAIGETSIVNKAEFEFKDDFESDTTKSFWADKSYVVRSAVPDSEAKHDSKVMLFKFDPGIPDSNNAWSEMRFRIPIKAQQLDIEFDQYVPLNYKHAAHNQKGLVLWSGAYGMVNANIGVSTEEWPATDGAMPSVYLGSDGNNKGHDFLDKRGGLMWYDNQGSWQHMHFYLELAENPKDIGIFEIYRNGEFLTGTRHPFMSANNDQISYSTRGNFIDQGYLMGWANGGYKEHTEFYIDNFVIKANSKIGKTVVTKEKKRVSIDSSILGVSTLNMGRTCIVHYSLPAQNIDYIRFDLFDLNGRRILQSKVKSATPGKNQHVLYSQNSYAIPMQGTYIVAMSVKFSNLTKIQRSIQKTMFVR